MAGDKTPTTMRAWQFSSGKGGLPQNLKLNAHVTVPKPTPTQHLVKVHAVGLNPVDYKVSENSMASAILIKKPAIPGIDFSGTIVKPAEGSELKVGDRVFGCGKSPFAGGMLAEYGTVEKETAVCLPASMSDQDGAAVGTAAITAYQSIKPKIGNGDRVFINGGSGGCGLWGIQIAKALGAEVTVSCSSRNLQTCKSFGADEALDYTEGSLLEKLIQSSHKKKYDLIIDNVFGDIELYWKAHQYTNDKALYQIIGSAPTLRSVSNTIKMAIIPSFLGGGKRKAKGFFAKTSAEDLDQLSSWVTEGKVKPPIDSTFEFEQVPEAYRKLKTSRAVGKIIVNVASSQLVS